MKNQNYQLGIRAIHQKDIKTAIVEAKRNHFDVVEIHFSSPQFSPEHYTKPQLNQIKSFAYRNHIVLQTHSELGQSLIQADEILRKAEKQKLKKMIQFSQNIGARCLTLHQGKAPVYHVGFGKGIHNDDLYSKYYTALFEDSIKHIISIAPKDLFICIENTDNFTIGYQKVLDKYLKTNNIFLTWDIMKNYSYKPTKFKEDQWKFLNRNISYVKNLHISGPAHQGLKGYGKKLILFLKLFQGKNVPMVLEILSLKEAIQAKIIIKNLGF